MARRTIQMPMPVPPERPLLDNPRIALGMAQQRIQRLEKEALELKNENDGLKLRYQHWMGCLIGCIRAHFNSKEFRFDNKAWDELKRVEGTENAFAVNTFVDDVTGEFVCELLSVKNLMRKMAGLTLGNFEATVPSKSPFMIRVSNIPEGATFEGCELCVYRSGKKKGLELKFVDRKPKAAREYTCDKTGAFTFSTDDAGQELTLQILIRRPVAEEEEESANESALEFKNDVCREWHTTPNDGDKIIGRACPECGDSRKV